MRKYDKRKQSAIPIYNFNGNFNDFDLSKGLIEKMNKTEKRNNQRFHIFRSTFKTPNSETFFNLNSTTKTLNTIVDKNELNNISLYITKNMKSNNLIGYQNRNMSIASASKNSFPIRNNKRMSNNWPKILNRLNSFTSSSIQNKIKFNSSILKVQKPHNFPFLEKYVYIR